MKYVLTLQNGETRTVTILDSPVFRISGDTSDEFMSADQISKAGDIIFILIMTSVIVMRVVYLQLIGPWEPLSLILRG